MMDVIKTYEIPIVEGHNPSSYFWIMPVIAESRCQIWEDEIEYLRDAQISIEEDYVVFFLRSFFLRHFEIDHWCNRSRFFSVHFHGEQEDRHGFEWHLDDNFYSYEAVERMLFEIELVARLLEIDYDNPLLDEIKSHYTIFFLCDTNAEPIDINDEKGEIRKRKGIIIDFYRRFATRMRKMMEDNPQTDKIVIKGP